MKRFNRQYLPIADAIARLEIEQTEREMIAEAIGNAISDAGPRVYPDFRYDLFVLLASDPLVECAGHHGEPYPHGRVIRIAMHNSNAPEGRSEAWRHHAPHGSIRCVSCGAAEFIPSYSGI
jgi:hypothetical protein